MLTCTNPFLVVELHYSVHIGLNYCTLLASMFFIPRNDGFEYPLDQDYEHFSECEMRLQGKLDGDLCRYVWDNWCGTSIKFNSSNARTRNSRQPS